MNHCHAVLFIMFSENRFYGNFINADPLSCVSITIGYHCALKLAWISYYNSQKNSSLQRLIFIVLFIHFSIKKNKICVWIVILFYHVPVIMLLKLKFLFCSVWCDTGDVEFNDSFLVRVYDCKWMNVLFIFKLGWDCLVFVFYVNIN